MDEILFNYYNYLSKYTWKWPPLEPKMFIVQRIVRFSWKNVLQLGKKLVFSFGVHNIIIMVVQKMKQKNFFFVKTHIRSSFGRKMNYSSLYIYRRRIIIVFWCFFFNFPHFWYYIYENWNILYKIGLFKSMCVGCLRGGAVY